MSTALPGHADVVVIGAGLAGLVASLQLSRAGLEVLLLEAADRPGGRVATEVVDGFHLDRGFQLINPAYPQLRRLAREGTLDLARLQLQSFDAGVRVALDGRHAVLADPRRNPADLASSLTAPLGSPVAKARFAAWALRCAFTPKARLLARDDEPYGRSLDRARVTGQLRTGVLDPFLAGVLGEDTGASSARFVALLARAFMLGSPAVPARGVRALPDQLAAALPSEVLRTGVRVDVVEGTTVGTSAGGVSARAVLVATDPVSAALFTGLPVPAMQALTTYWFAAAAAPCARPILHLDGLRRGPVVNSAVLSAAAPGYSPDGRALIAATVVGAAGASDGRDNSEAAVRRHTATIYGIDAAATAEWELLRVDEIREALPAMLPPLDIRQPVDLGAGRFVAGDHRDTASQQGALASGARAARAIRRYLGAPG